MTRLDLAAEKDETDELAQAEARALAARARATRLHQLAHTVSSDSTNAARAWAVAAKPVSRRWRPRRPGRHGLSILATAGCISASLAASGYVVWHHHEVGQQRLRSAQFASAARGAILAMLSINANTARADVQRFVDETTGQFKVGILLSAEDFVKTVEQTKGGTKGSVQAVAVQSMSTDSAVVLVAGRSELTKPDQPKTFARQVRAVVSIEREGGQLKVSGVEFLP